MTTVGSGTRAGALAYWAFAIALTAFGLLDLVGIGAPFFLLGATLLGMGRFRHRPRAFWPPVVAVLAFIIALVLVVPLGCTRTPTAQPGSGPATEGRTSCSNALGIGYSGGGDYQPSYLPALFAGLVAGVAGASLTARLARRS